MGQLSKDLELFNELIVEEVPDVEIDETLFAYYSDCFQVVITKVAKIPHAFKMIGMYKLAISGKLNITRFIKNKENALIKASLLINDFANEQLQEKSNDRSYFSTSEFED